MQKTTQPKVSNFFQKSRGAKVAAIAAGVVVIVAGVFVIRSLASSFYASTEAEQGTVASNATVVTDSTASGGKAIEFNAPQAIPAPPVGTPPPGGTPNGWPAANNTGYPHGLAGDTRTPVTLTDYTGPTTITQAGTVIDSKRIEGPLYINAHNVVIKNSYIHVKIGPSPGGDTTHAVFSTDDNNNLIIQDTEISAMANATDSTDLTTGGSFAVGRTGYTLVRDNIYGSGDILRIDGGGTVQDTWLHDPGGTLLSPTNGEQHNDVIQSTNAFYINVFHNRMDNPHIQTSCMLLKADLGSISNVSVRNNLFNGGGISFYWYDSNNHSTLITQGSGSGVTGNRWLRSPTGGYFPNGGAQAGPAQVNAVHPPVNWSDNAWLDTGAAISD
ncbi:MAG TPA: hypothetical protein VLF71_00765 [Candidatus Saccharimonadales bacterium]|nr:hypothetical protein [Candidatus Saccharimonadales bacterium]